MYLENENDIACDSFRGDVPANIWKFDCYGKFQPERKYRIFFSGCKKITFKVPMEAGGGAKFNDIVISGLWRFMTTT
jgi:hypothetical protein